MYKFYTDTKLTPTLYYLVSNCNLIIMLFVVVFVRKVVVILLGTFLPADTIELCKRQEATLSKVIY